MEEEYVVGHFNVTLLCELLLTSLLLPTQQCGRSCIGRFLHDTLQSFYSHPHQTFIPKSGGNFSLPKLARRVKTVALAELLSKPRDKSTLLRERSTLLCANIVARYKTTQKRFHVLHDLQTKMNREIFYCFKLVFYPPIDFGDLWPLWCQGMSKGRLEARTQACGGE